MSGKTKDSLFHQRFTKNGETRVSATWYMRIRQNGREERIALFTDRGLSAGAAVNIRRLANMRAGIAVANGAAEAVSAWANNLDDALHERLARIGLVASRTQAVTRTLSALVDEYADHLRTGSDPVQAGLVAFRVRRVLDGCGFAAWADVTCGAVEKYVASLRVPETDPETGKVRRRAVSKRTARFHLEAVRGFGRWLVAEGKAGSSPLERIDMKNRWAVSDDEETEWRALDADEMRWLFHTTMSGPDRLGMPGAERAMLYAVGAECGERSESLCTATAGQFKRLLSDDPSAEFKNRKNGRNHTVPLQRDTAAALADFIGAKMPAARVFPNAPHKCHRAKMLRRDLAAARAAWIAEGATAEERTARDRSDFLAGVDSQGRRVTFHSLRHTAGSLASQSGAVAPVIGKILGHRDGGTLALKRYVRPYSDDVRRAVDSMPSTMAQPSRGTGTYGAGR